MGERPELVSLAATPLPARPAGEGVLKLVLALLPTRYEEPQAPNEQFIGVISPRQRSAELSHGNGLDVSDRRRAGVVRRQGQRLVRRHWAVIYSQSYQLSAALRGKPDPSRAGETCFRSYKILASNTHLQSPFGRFLHLQVLGRVGWDLSGAGRGGRAG